MKLRYVAVALELAMLATFVAKASIVGVALWIAYFSATWAVGLKQFEKDE